MARLLAWVLASGRAGAGGPGGAGAPDGAAACMTDADCPPGQLCGAGGACRGGDGAAPAPDIDLDPPDELDFGSPILGAEVALDLLVRNVGDQDLAVSTLELIEDGLAVGEEPEFSLLAPDLPLSIEPGGVETVAVALRPRDDDEDRGRIVVGSSDADEPTLVVDLWSEIKGDPILRVCVPIGEDPPGDCAEPAVVDFGGVAWGAVVTRMFTIENAGDGNRPIRLDDADVVGSAALFALEFVAVDGDDETPVALPYLLPPAGDGAAPDRMGVRVTFTAEDEDSLLSGGDAVRLEWQPGAPVEPGGPDAVTEATVPLVAVFLDCGPGRFDVDPDVPGCEYACLFAGAADGCDGVDDDCDGAIDEDFDPSVCGLGACAAGAACVGGAPVCGTPAADDAICDGEDDDCDGETDEDWEPWVCGTGACAAVATCVDGVDSCAAGAPEPETCDGEDDDCDFAIDDGANGCGGACPLAPPPCAACCDVPEDLDACDDDAVLCTGPNDTACVDAAYDADGDGYAPGPASCSGDCDDADAARNPAAPETPNGEDDDCDGVADEGLGSGENCDDPLVLPGPGSVTVDTCGMAADVPISCGNAASPDAVVAYDLPAAADVTISGSGGSWSVLMVSFANAPSCEGTGLCIGAPGFSLDFSLGAGRHYVHIQGETASACGAAPLTVSW